MRCVIFALPLLTLALLPVGTLATTPVGQAPAAFEGRPTFKEGSDRSYFVWSDGNEWNVRWTTLGQMQTFTGSIRAMGGKLQDLKRIDVDAELKVVRPGRPARVVRGPAGRVRVAPDGAPSWPRARTTTSRRLTTN